MLTKILFATALLAAGTSAGSALAQSSQSTQATSPGQSGASNTIPQAPSGGRAGAGATSGAPIDAARQADQDNKADVAATHAATSVCKGC